MIKQREPIVAIATPYGESSIGVIRVSGEGVLERLSSILKVKGKIVPRYATLFQLLDEKGEPIDEGILIYYKGPNSYTGEDVLELQLHGNPLILRRALESITFKGVRLAEPGEFTKRAFLNGKIDLTQAEAVIDLIRAKTDLARKVALRQLQGELSKHINPLREKLLELLAYVEADIEFAEEDIPTITKRQIMEIIEGVIEHLQNLLSTARKGEFIRRGINLAIVGKPNVGKSSIFNLLVGHERSIVTHIPGTTRDYLQEEVHIDGIPINLIDTAGIRETTDEVEKIGVSRSLQKLHSADVVVFVVDASKPLEEEDKKVYNLVKDKDHIIVLNKKDLGMNYETLTYFPQGIKVSAKVGEGIEELRRYILQRVGVYGMDSMDVFLSVRHADLLNKAMNVLTQTLENLGKEDVSPEILALDLRVALSSIEEVIGTITAEDILGSIFSRFCIGK